MRKIGWLTLGFMLIGSTAFADLPGLKMNKLRTNNHLYTAIEIEVQGVVTGITLVHPSQSDQNTLLAVAGTYTNSEGNPDGVVIDRGGCIIGNRKPWDGAIVTVDGHVEILHTRAGGLSPKFLTEIQSLHGSMIQGHLLVYAGTVQPLDNTKRTARRAIVRRWNGSTAIIESADLQAYVTLAEFADDLSALDVLHAMNLDMGDYAYGWYRNEKQASPIPLGCCQKTARKQTNWIVVRRP